MVFCVGIQSHELCVDVLYTVCHHLQGTGCVTCPAVRVYLAGSKHTLAQTPCLCDVDSPSGSVLLVDV